MTQPPPDATTARAPGAVLVVDDDAEIRETLEEVLSDHGYAVACASNGLEALRYLRAAAPPCVILLDLMMPVMDGWEFRSHQRADPALSGIPVFVVTAGGNCEDAARKLEAAGCLRKPLALEKLLSVVRGTCAC